LTVLGVRLAIDDFGTGYSSLSYLQRLPVDTLKIDRSFIDGLEEDSHDSAIARAIVGLGRSLGLQVLAEGVETEQQRHALVAMDCALGQGYLWTRPLSLARFSEWVADTREHMAAEPYAQLVS
jgi:EAL domain-containing protein (putative c-di-GMP-specific phosphodiesterase class I)